MKNLILVALILQLVITIVGSHDFQFGDIISFPHRCIRMGKKQITYKHFAVYVGNQYPGKEDGEYIFERLKKSPVDTRPMCVFSQLNMNDEPQKSNYLDGIKDKYPKFKYLDKILEPTRKNILNHIQKLVANCGRYGLLHNNCEHLATYVRYGLKISLQFNLSGEEMCMNAIDPKALYKYVRDTTCSTAQASPSGSRPGSSNG